MKNKNIALKTVKAAPFLARGLRYRLRQKIEKRPVSGEALIENRETGFGLRPTGVVD